MAKAATVEEAATSATAAAPARKHSKSKNSLQSTSNLIQKCFKKLNEIDLFKVAKSHNLFSFKNIFIDFYLTLCFNKSTTLLYKQPTKGNMKKTSLVIK